MSCDILGHLGCAPLQPSRHDGSPVQAAGFSAPAFLAQSLYLVADPAKWQPDPVQLPDVLVIPAGEETQPITCFIYYKASLRSPRNF